MFTSTKEVRALNSSEPLFKFAGNGKEGLFDSRIANDVVEGEFFVTSELDETDVRRYSVRRAIAGGGIAMMSRLREFETNLAAREYIQDIAAPIPLVRL